jgi:protein TonB
MRVLVVDQDSTLLTEISRTLGDYFAIDAVSTKADCLDLVRANEFDVIVACERLEDGSGLELLGHLARSRPDMLRIFAADRQRMKLLKGRLSPFGLFRTLSYPIEPRQLLAALSAAAGIEEEVEETAEPAVLEPTQVQVVTQPRARSSVPASSPQSSSTRAPAPTQAPAPSSPRPTKSSRAQARNPHGVKGGHANTSGGAPQRSPRQPTPAALAAASRMDIVARSKGFPPPLPLQSNPTRSAFMVAAGVVLVLGGLWLSFKIFNTKDAPATTLLSPAHPTGFPPEVVKLVTDTEAAFQQDDLKAARTDVAALQQIAPDHPRLPFFESLLTKLQSNSRESAAKRLLQRHTSAPDAERPHHSVTTPAPAAQASSPQPPAVKAFSGRTLEEDTSSASASATSGPAPTPTPGSTPKLIQRVPPDYPPEAERRGIEGSVDVSFTVTSEGKVTDVVVIHSQPSDIFDRAAASAVRRWRYEPQRLEGTPVESHLQIRIDFKLDAPHH